jgi:DNA-binding NarL/FixJ family response regulator
MRPIQQKIRIMLAADHQMVVWGLRALINGESPRMEVVSTASAVEEILPKYRRAMPDIILLDLQLNGMSALDVIPPLTLHDNVRVLMLADMHEQDKLDQALLKGARGILRKDIPPEQVLKAIEKTYQGELWVDHNTLCRVFGRMRHPAPPAKLDLEEQKQALLTPKEKKIVQAMVEFGGNVNKTLAQRLFISEHTLRNHLTSIYQKLNVNNRLELYIYAIKHRLGTSHVDADAHTETSAENMTDKARSARSLYGSEGAFMHETGMQANLR